MVTKMIPYACPVCHGTGEDPFFKDSQETTYRFLEVGETIQEGDEYNAGDEILGDDWIRANSVGTSVRDVFVGYYRRSIPKTKEKCRSCKGPGIVWGTEVEDTYPTYTTYYPYTWASDNIKGWTVRSNPSPFSIIKRENYPFADFNV
jgi:hypothetical protein